MTRDQIAEIILTKLKGQRDSLQEMFLSKSPKIPFFILDDVLPEPLVQDIYNAFPDSSGMRERKTLREHKFVSAQMDNLDGLLEEALFAFQDKRVIDEIGVIIEKDNLCPDELLYAGGISMMSENHFLNPHLDNSHDMNRKLWRSLNLLFYVTPNWSSKSGGSLELWPNGVGEESIVIESKFNRLVVMGTGDASWHSVSPIKSNDRRCCISNYYFSPTPIDDNQKFRVTSFRDRNKNSMRDFILRLDTKTRMGLRRIKPDGFKQTDHFYKR